MQTLLAFSFVLGVLVFVHELGHFLLARWHGVRVITFSLGFGPKLLSFKRGDTEYCLSAIPLGGYVKMAGENPEDQPQGAPDEFLSKSKWQRFQILHGRSGDEHDSGRAAARRGPGTGRPSAGVPEPSGGDRGGAGRFAGRARRHAARRRGGAHQRPRGRQLGGPRGRHHLARRPRRGIRACAAAATSAPSPSGRPPPRCRCSRTPPSRSARSACFPTPIR